MRECGHISGRKKIFFLLLLFLLCVPCFVSFSVSWSVSLIGRKCLSAGRFAVSLAVSLGVPLVVPLQRAGSGERVGVSAAWKNFVRSGAGGDMAEACAVSAALAASAACRAQSGGWAFGGCAQRKMRWGGAQAGDGCRFAP